MIIIIIKIKFFPKICLFIFCVFYLNEEELIQQACLLKYIANEISNSTSHKTENKREEQKHNLTPKSSFLKLLKIVTSYISYTVKFLILLLLHQTSYLCFHSLQKRFKCPGNKHRELSFCHRFHPFTILRMHGLSIWLCHRLLHIDASQFFELASNCLVYSNH